MINEYEDFAYDPDPRALHRHPGSEQCPERDGGYWCTLVAGHVGNDHHTFGRSKVNHSWTKP